MLAFWVFFICFVLTSSAFKKINWLFVLIDSQLWHLGIVINSPPVWTVPSLGFQHLVWFRHLGSPHFENETFKLLFEGTYAGLWSLRGKKHL